MCLYNLINNLRKRLQKHLTKSSSKTILRIFAYLCISTLMEQARGEPFLKLLNLEKKYAKYSNHLNFLKECETHNVISKGFRLRKSANIGHVSDTFTEDWDNVLEDCSHKLQKLLIDEIPAVLTSIR